MKTTNNIQLKFTVLLFALCFWLNEASAYDWAVEPVVAVDSYGNVTAAWEGTDPTTGNAVIQTSYLPNGGSWTSVQTLTSTSNNSYGPQLSVNDSGDAVLVWITYDSSGNTAIQASIEPSNGTWGSISTLSSSTEIVLSNYNVWLSSNGSIIAGWNSYVDTTYVSVIRASTATVSTGTWTPATTISP